MKTAIVSDLHLANKVDQPRLDYLNNLFSSVDRVIINGDFWDLHSITFKEFMSSPWKSLFPLLKQKHTIYIEGNHDHARDTGGEIFELVDKHVSEFTLHSGKYTLHIEHGHRKLHRKSETSPLLISGFRSLQYNTWFRDPLEKFLISRNNDTLHRWHMNKHDKTLRKIAFGLPKHHILVTGHTHLPSFSPEMQYINTGYINHGVAYYLLVEDGKLSFVKDQYFPEKKRLLYQTIS